MSAAGYIKAVDGPPRVGGAITTIRGFGLEAPELFVVVALFVWRSPPLFMVFSSK